MSEFVIYVPGRDDDQIANGLYDLTETLVARSLGDPDYQGGILGGAYGYGTPYENDEFMMHPFCWCDEADCGWCDGRTPNFLHKPSGSRIRWYKWIGRGMEIDLTAPWPEVIAACLRSLPSPVSPADGGVS